MLDKARPNHYSDKDLDVLLDTTYGPEYNRQFGLAPEHVVTRRINGEREYRLRDWRDTAAQSGLSSFDYWRVEKPRTGGVAGYIKQLVSLLPPRVQILLSRYIPQRKQSHSFILDASHRIFTHHMDHFRKEMSIMVAYKL